MSSTVAWRWALAGVGRVALPLLALLIGVALLRPAGQFRTATSPSPTGQAAVLPAAGPAPDLAGAQDWRSQPGGVGNRALAFPGTTGPSVPATDGRTTPVVPGQPAAVDPPGGIPLGWPPADLAGLLDPAKWRDWVLQLFPDLVTLFFKQLLTPLDGVVTAAVAAMERGSQGFTTPILPDMTYAQPAVQGYQRAMREAAEAGLLLVLIGTGINVIISERLGFTYQDAMETLPRFAVGAFLVHFADVPCRLAIDVADALIYRLGTVEPPGWQLTSGDPRSLGDVLMLLFYFVSLLCVVIGVYLRVVYVDLLLIAAPLAFLCWILPQTQEVARRWLHLFGSVVAAFFLQAVALRVGGDLLRTGFAGVNGSAYADLVALALSGAFFIFLFKVPGLVGAHIGGGGAVVRLLATRAAFGALAGGRAPAPYVLAPGSAPPPVAGGPRGGGLSGTSSGATSRSAGHLAGSAPIASRTSGDSAGRGLAVAGVSTGRGRSGA